ncbi:MAG: flippase, partial [Candidatus Wildermuthbacteria bacterium]|nr:flippase [Candidatus Wildermuthbacteria bacterium]
MLNLSAARAFLFDNLTVKQTIIKNTFWISLSGGFGKVLRAFLAIYIARVLGATEYGKFTFALAFVSLFVSFFDFGLSPIITRELAREKEKEKDFSALLSLKFVLGFSALILMFITAFFITSDPQIRKIVWVLSLFTFLSQLPEIFYALLRARQRMEYVSWATILETALLVGIGFFIILKYPSAQNVSYGYLFAGLIFVSLLLLFFNFKVLPLRPALRADVWKKFLKMSWPLALISMSTMLYSYIDSVLMGHWKMITETGWYNATLKIVGIVLVPPSVVVMSFYPALSKLMKESRDQLQKAWDYQLKIIISLAMPVVVGGITLAPQIINF